MFKKNDFKLRDETLIEKKRTRIKRTSDLVNSGFLQTMIAAVILVVFFVAANHYIDNLFGVFNISIFFTIVFTYFLNSAVKVYIKWYNKRHEDTLKLDDNYNKITRRYHDELIVYDNSSASEKNLKKLRELESCKHAGTGQSVDGLVYRFPVKKDFNISGKDFVIEDCLTEYYLPREVHSNFGHLMSAHTSSNIYNRTNVRVDSWSLKEDTFQMCTSRTMYFYSLVTNRSMDYLWPCGVTNRDMYCCGPFLPALRESKLSNHLGFNGFIVSSDGYLPFVKRNDYVSIGKNTYGNSIGASLKTKYALLNGQDFTVEGLENAIVREIYDELRIDKEELFDFQLKTGLVAAYRDLIEGGKPQLLFMAKSILNRDTIDKRFSDYSDKKRNEEKIGFMDKERKAETDGSTILWIHESELHDLGITPHCIVHNGIIYETVPSASAALVMLLESLSTGDFRNNS